MDALTPLPLPPRGLSDDALMDATACAALRYFTEFAHPVSGMARERSAGAFGYDVHETVTTGGTGFGVMALLSGARRGWISQAEAEARVERIAGFLAAADSFRGVFPHFLNGETGRTLPFMPGDDGGDLVETALLMAGLLAARQFFDGRPVAAKIDRLWRAVDWSAHVRPSDRGLMWHRSPNRPWTRKSLPIRGWNECLIAYVLAASSPSHPIPSAIYHDVWAMAEQFRNGHTYYGVRLPLGPELGGPMFLSQYSFLGLDPSGLIDRYADYGEQTRAHAQINRAHCIQNPHGHLGYGPECWGLSASDSPDGYAAHSPTHDLGVITPTAAVASIPYTPDESLAALRHFVEAQGEAIWGPFGLADAFRPSDGWVARSNLAIDQGPIVVMIENHRSGLLWELLMGAPEIRRGLRALGFESPRLAPVMV